MTIIERYRLRRQLRRRAAAQLRLASATADQARTAALVSRHSPGLRASRLPVVDDLDTWPTDAPIPFAPTERVQW